jgi:hypothetical protein
MVMVAAGDPQEEIMRSSAKCMLMAVAAAAVITGAASSAQAGGFLADTFIRPFSPKLAREADKAHARMGNPLDHAANAAAGRVADALVPGSGPAVQAALEARRAAK